ncbi:MAG: hypothetical protein ACJA2X_001981 [Halocynthiibacter sp.]|jgi:hypothetical protein
MSEIKTKPLFNLTLEVGALMDMRAGAALGRVIFEVSGGRFEGARLRGKVMPASADWQTVEQGYARMHVRLALQTDDGALIYMIYEGRNTIDADIRARIAAGEDVDPSEYYLRTVPIFETGDARYDWLNRIVAVSNGARTGAGVEYAVFEVL